MRSAERRKLALHLAAGALDAAERRADDPRRSGPWPSWWWRTAGGGARSACAAASDRRAASPTTPRTAIGRCAAAISSPARAMAASGARRELRRRARRRHLLVGRRERHVLRQIEMHRPLRLAQREPDGLGQRLADAARCERQRRLGDRLEQRVVVDPHLDAAAELVGVEVAGDRDAAASGRGRRSRRRSRDWSRRARAWRCKARARRSCGR